MYVAVNRFFWPRMQQDIKNYCNLCHECASRNDPTPRFKANIVKCTPSFVLERVVMDILGPLTKSKKDNKDIHVVSYYHSKFVEAYPFTLMESKTIDYAFINQFLFRYGVPKIIHTTRVQTST
ncbi:Retrovirus-related Pol polyprotein [Thelohanellus kitauei]|uniref:Retrovirus-related Pol polyprotein n=1 Tax=Thelohanellus kitauei TaxID=669202 RepID=A0A0C2IZC1_THEKT|nr:Retrovirus-related Pol polyprotein [Thelohanellus kitauei]